VTNSRLAPTEPKVTRVEDRTVAIDFMACSYFLCKTP
jgi:hypothetical protein